MLRRPPRSTRSDPLFPYTPLFRSVITGSSAFDRSWEEAARRELAAFSSKLTITFLANLSLDALMARLAALPGRPALLYLTMFEGPEDRKRTRLNSSH